MKPAAPTAAPTAADVIAQLAAARGEVAEAAARSRTLRKQVQAEDLAQAARSQRQHGAADAAAALEDDAETARRRSLDIKA